MSKPYRVAIIGVGAIGQLHAKAIGALDNVQIVGGFHTAPEAAQKFATDNHCEAFTDYQQMLDEVKPDFATICTLSGAHVRGADQRGLRVGQNRKTR